MIENNFNITGLTQNQVLEARKKYGHNILHFKKESGFLYLVKNLIKEPMVILLLVTSSIYFITGNSGDGVFLAVAIVLVSAISLYQDSRSRDALEKLKIYTQPNCKVIREGVITEIKIEELVIGDCMMVEEGTTIPADGNIVHSNDFSVNESILTGESFSVYKNQIEGTNSIYMGTMIASGLAIAIVTHIGNETKLGKIGKSLEDVLEEKTPLEVQINNFVKKMVIVGVVIFLIVWVINYFNSYNVLDSLLKALTLAMSILPEEIPVAFTTFMAMGAWRLMKMGVVVKQMKTVETLGSATVICSDKTGTITENKMSLAKLYSFESKRIISTKEEINKEEKELIRTAMWASEPIPFDPMEIALHENYNKFFTLDERPLYKMYHEYPLDGKPPMMTHIFQDDAGNRIIAAKGAPEALLNVSNLIPFERKQIEETINILANDGYRVLGVGRTVFKSDNFPSKQQDFQFSFKGLVAFYDPPKQNIQSVFDDFNTAGITVKIITGDNAATTRAIAKQISFKDYDKSISGDELMNLSDSELSKTVSETQIFTRMFPEAKLKIINALKLNGEVVAMVGDGVNDGPALKTAHIGIAMGKKGTEIAKDAASLILVDDDLSKMVDAVAMGRKIYTNLKKAIQYIISIHIPIILTVFIPLVLGWIYPNILSPIHIILLELIMGPTCSIVYENEPMEEDTMLQKPRPYSVAFFNWKELTTSIIQGLMITIGVLIMYQYAVAQGYNEAITRTMVFIVLMSANIFLTFVNRSFYYSVFTTIKYKNRLIPIVIGVTTFITTLLLFVRPLNEFFQFEILNASLIVKSIGAGFVSVIWFEIVKWLKRKNRPLNEVLR
ncbi:Cation transport ATPase [Winogradskyella psychrotolerans RS-3]|uniref:Cation transport ATPase n=1 Tax=Winogradskyella psychrotolerans RS-3 TaxID=641526 RepID=S7VUS6_9FLAO|nr:cation-translocating P-type ATPase [Winogradskyella psychrotolerans]EPR73791.1 Cation transport ATPase [Winogradskyella psychrotolerans RS-3]